MVVLVCGSRDYRDKAMVWHQLDTLHSMSPIKAVVHGDAYGADTYVAIWARRNGVEERKFPAKWKIYGIAAGPKRNQQMLDENDDIELVMAFFTDRNKPSKGTTDMCFRAEVKKIPIRIF